MPWVTADHPTRAELNACVQCGLCLPHCPTFRLTGLETASPRGRLQAMNAVAHGIAEVDAAFAEIMGFCLQCRACEAVCPGLAPFGRAMEGARAEVTAQLPATSRRLRHLILGRFLPSRRWVGLATAMAGLAQRTRLGRLAPSRFRRGLSGLRQLPTPSVIGMKAVGSGDRGTVGLLSGCVMDSWFGQVHQATVELLSMSGYRVLIPTQQTCCGALAAHDGAADVARRLARRNLEAFADVDLVVADAAGCSAHLKGYHHLLKGGSALSDKAKDVTELVATLIDEGSLPQLGRRRGPVAVQDPCHLRHAQRVVAAPRTILTAAGYELVEIDPDGLCCGAAGIYSILRPEASAELGRRKADQVRRSGSTIVSSANPGCEMQLRAQLEGWYRIAHPVELYWEALSSSRVTL